MARGGPSLETLILFLTITLVLFEANIYAQQNFYGGYLGAFAIILFGCGATIAIILAFRGFNLKEERKSR